MPFWAETSVTLLGTSSVFGQEAERFTGVSRLMAKKQVML